MKKIESNNEKLIEGVNYFTKQMTTWNNIVWTSFNASIGNTKFQCTSLEQLEQSIKSYKFETEKDRKLTIKAVAEFGTNA